MEQSFTFSSVSSFDTLNAAIYLLPPFAAEIRQGVRLGPEGMRFHAYHEFIDCSSVEELHDFLTCSENGVRSDQPFSVAIEEITDTGDDHPSLSAAERNPSML